jgi:hypothetical protein
MTHSASELLGVHLARMQVLIESLEAECAKTTEQREMFQVLKRELDESRKLLKTINQ